jgi:phosphate transport system ATP-binding protein
MIIKIANLNLYYDKFQALKNVNLSIKENLITGIIGPSGCGKSTLLRVFNRMNDLIKNVKITGSILIDKKDIYSPVYDLILIVERSLAAVDLFDSIKDRLKDSALSLSAEKQQRLCIARLLAVEPQILLMDEPCSALDPIATGKIEELMMELKKKYTIIIVTHNMQQAARIADDVGFMLLGELIEFASAKKIFTNQERLRN